MQAMKSFYKSIGPVVSLIVGFFIFIAIFGPWVSPYDPNAQNLLAATQSFSTE
jgi:ABC-type antimicrobial peptide transport system permease subunit